jgi:hypothetical protein
MLAKCLQYPCNSCFVISPLLCRDHDVFKVRRSVFSNSSQQDGLHEVLEVAWCTYWSKPHSQRCKLSLLAKLASPHLPLQHTQVSVGIVELLLG